jgi:sugar phosphate isomerase/epimerase
LKVLATNWGFQGTVDAFCAAAKKEGYDGIEMWWPNEQQAQDELFNALAKHGLEVGFLCGGSQADWQQHLNYFKKAIDAAAYNKVKRPLYINCHSGRDHFDAAHNQLFIDHTLKLSKETGIRICHETHRGRILYSAPIARTFLEKNPDLKLTLDISHWCNVHESLLQDQQATVALALERTEHIHTRVGHAEGPQVSDPRAPEWQQALNAHLQWWDTVIARKKKAGEMMTLLTEFGPADYMWTLPYTRQPLANQWEINVHMMHLLKSRWL